MSWGYNKNFEEWKLLVSQEKRSKLRIKMTLAFNFIISRIGTYH